MTGIKRLRAIAGAWDEWGLGGALTEIADEIDRAFADARMGHVSLMRILEVAGDMERHCLGHEGMEDSPVARWARELREALGGDEHDHADKREDVTWVREHGGLDSVKKLLDWVVGHCSTKQQLDFDFWLSGRVMHELGFDEDMADRDEVERRLLARLMPEGMEWLRYEETPMDNYEGEEWRPVNGFDKKGDTVWEVGTVLAIPMTVVEVSSDLVRCEYTWKDGKTYRPCYPPDQLTHTKPERDSWERVEKDAGKSACTYFCHSDVTQPPNCGHDVRSCRVDMTEDLVRRCKALAEKESRNE